MTTTTPTPTSTPQCLMSHRVFCFLHHYPINGSSRNLVRSCSRFPGEKLHHLKGEPVNAPPNTLPPPCFHSSPSRCTPPPTRSIGHTPPNTPACFSTGTKTAAPPPWPQSRAEQSSGSISPAQLFRFCSPPPPDFQTKRQKEEEEKFCSSSNVRTVTTDSSVRVCSRRLQLQ